MKKIITSILLCLAAISAQAKIAVEDMFGRELNNYQITMVDWQGHLYNPMIELTLKAPQSGVSFPLSVTLSAEGTSRLMLNYPSTVSASGAQKTVTFSSRSSTQKIFLEIAPDRAGGYGEIEQYTFRMRYGNQSETIPIKVIDQDDSLQPKLPVKFDYSNDNIARLFNNSATKAAAEAAIKDWFYFFDYSSFDQVPAYDESLWLTGDDWKNHVEVKNNAAYNGYWVFMHSIHSPYSTGYVQDNSKYIKKNGVTLPGPLHRASALVLHFNPGANVFNSLNDEDWHKTSPYEVTDVYGLVMHEFGHAIGFSHQWAGFNDYANNYRNATKMIEYQGNPVEVDESAHVKSGSQNWDRISGQSAGYESVFPVLRWMISKQSLLILDHVGWKIREIGPFLKPAINTQSLPDGTTSSSYNQTLQANGGGVPFYEWKIIQGSLPAGLTLNSFTGKISGNITASSGTYSFKVQLRDYDKLSDPVTKNLSIRVSSSGGSSCTAPTVEMKSIAQTEATLRWSDYGSSSEFYIYYRAVGGDWQYEGGITQSEKTLTGLQADTKYEAWVNSMCPNGNPSTQIFFTTKDNAVTCSAPTIEMKSIAQTEATLRWSDYGSANEFYIYYRAVGGDWQYEGGITQSEKTLTGLQADTKYEAWVNSMCPNGNPSTQIFFTTKKNGDDDGGIISNLAKGKPFAVSSTWGSGYEGWRANDGNSSSRWASGGTGGNRWIYFDLEDTYSIKSVKVKWEAAYGKNYTIDVWTGSSWRTIKTVSNNRSLTNDLSVSDSARYVRLNCTSGVYSHISIYELEVYGSK